MKVSSKKQLFFLGLMSVLGLTACSKNCPQSDLDNARKEGATSAVPNATQKVLTAAIKNFNAATIQLQKVQDSLRKVGYYPGNTAFTDEQQGKILSALGPVVKKAITELGTVIKSANNSSIKIFADGTENGTTNGSNGTSTGTASIIIGFEQKGEGNQTFTLPSNAGTIILKNSDAATGIPNFTWLFTIEVYINDASKAENKIGEITNIPTFSLIFNKALQQLKEQADAAR